METGNIPIRTLIHRRQLGFYRKLKESGDCLAGRILEVQERLGDELPHSWYSRVKMIFTSYEITYQKSVSKEGWKNYIRKPTRVHADSLVLGEAAKLSKLSCLLQSKQSVKRENYLSSMPFRSAQLLFKARCRMLNLGNNFRRGDNQAPMCGLCNLAPETDKHIIDECAFLQPQRDSLGIKRDDIFNLDKQPPEVPAKIVEFLNAVEKDLRRL